ncbi:hypothetical protein GCM10009865_28190 [Aeromicrobium ponti]|uniref:Uncharacterized protein n=1 Tax=Cytobacillus oceanisediminis TaxID=665099 RepID=A0A562JS31_9BACI|nr:hypothetical protein [Cytobacillus oceanisediminis]TWH85961.1 hypothetical protein IQ19_02902 [Cytobacillus oceanisediminis]
MKYDYAEGKRQAEAYFFRNASFPAVAVRIAMVVSGTDDYTGRFDYYVKHIAEHKSIGVLESEHTISYVTAWDAAKFPHFIGAKSDFAGPINASNGSSLSIQEHGRHIGECLNVEPLFHLGSRVEQLIPLCHALYMEAGEYQNGVCRFCVFTDSEVDCRYGPGKHGATGHWNKRPQHLNIYETAMGEAWQLIRNPYPVG